MRRALALACLLAPLAAAGQAWSFVGRDRGYPTGLALPGAGVASGEEPSAVSVNPAAAGFNRGLTFQYFHERASGVLGGDGVYAGLGPLALSSEWVRPSGTPHYRKLSLGLGLGGREGSLGLTWNDWSSSDPGIAQLRTFDVGLTVRPLRWLSVGAAALDLDGRQAGIWLPVRYRFGLATRLAGDALTAWADWLADDAAARSFRSRAVAVGLGWETPFGVALQGEMQLPTQSAGGVAGSTLFLASLAFNSGHVGGVGAAGGTRSAADRSTLFGVRLSTRAYRGFRGRARPVVVDLAEGLEPPFSLLTPRPRDPFGALVRRLRALGRDPEVDPVVLRFDRLSLAPGHADELRAAILELRERKAVVAWLQGAGLQDYYVATAAGRIEMAPPAVLQLTGLSSTGLYLRDALAKLGISFQAVAIGKYKNAPDALARGDMSAAEREVREAVLDDLFARQVKAIAEARKLPEARVRELVDQGLFQAVEAKQAGLVDALSWPDELERRTRATPGAFQAHYQVPEPRLAQRWGPRPAVAVIRVAGTIVPGRSRGGPLDVALSGADTVAELVRTASQDREVKAIVLRVDSPGGDALASDLIWRALVAAKRKGKPLVVSMGDVAASGGYWIATAGDAILAEPSTLTGSIGVFALKPDLSGLLSKIDARAVTLKRGARADLESVVRPWSEEEQQAIRRELGAMYETFLARVAEARRLTRDEVDRVAQGRVWTGQQALERRLVDRIGSLADAVALARERAGIAASEDVALRILEPPRSFLDDVGAGLSSGSGSALERLLLRAPEVQAAAALLEMGPVVALPLGWVEPLASPPGGGP
ncbi:MAG TPA: signal peptide peptidase SppA [Anaeromyxobacteraceae bacterium]|nr:signal peptide peptidase SppA [Anaeromyxobacteraceae bacterium]